MTTPVRSWQPIEWAIPDPSSSEDMDALQTFERTQPSSPNPKASPKAYAGFPSPGSGIYWTAKVQLPRREEIVRQYSQLHPQQLDSLVKWIEAAPLDKASLRSITIACFTVTDPFAYYYIDRGPESAAIEAFWDWESDTWRAAETFNRSQSPERLNQLRQTIESTACSKASFAR